MSVGPSKSSDNSSKSTGDLLDVKAHERFNKAPPKVIQWVQQTGDGLLGFAGCLHSLSEQLDKSAISYMKPEEKKTFAELEAEKMDVVNKIKLFIMKEKLRFLMMVREAQVNSSMSDLTRNVRPEKHVAEIQVLQSELNQLRTKYLHFSEELKENCKSDGRSTQKILVVVSGVANAVAAIGAVVILIIHFTPGTNFVLCPIGWSLVALSSVTAVAAGGTILARSLQKTEIDRALDYMKNLQENLEKLKTLMQEMEGFGVVLAENSEVEAFQEMASELVKRCCYIEEICDEVSRQFFCR